MWQHNRANTEPTKRLLTLKMEDATKTPPGAHSHEVTLTLAQVEMAKKRTPITSLITSSGAGHQHNITIEYRAGKWRIRHCDDYDKGRYRCRDQHGMFLSENDNV